MRLPIESLGERLIAVVPMIGKGTNDDPIRPKYTPVGMNVALMEQLKRENRLPELREKSEAERIADDKVRIGAFSYVLSDDGKRAIVEFVARDKAAFAEILKDSQVKAIEKGKLKDAAELEELRRVRKDFDPKDLRTPGY